MRTKPNNRHLIPRSVLSLSPQFYLLYILVHIFHLSCEFREIFRYYTRSVYLYQVCMYYKIYKDRQYRIIILYQFMLIILKIILVLCYYNKIRQIKYRSYLFREIHMYFLTIIGITVAINLRDFTGVIFNFCSLASVVSRIFPANWPENARGTKQVTLFRGPIIRKMASHSSR